MQREAGKKGNGRVSGDGFRGRLRVEHKEPYGYITSFGYKGWVESLGSYILFATEQEYIDYILE